MKEIDWIKINPLPEHDEKCKILLKSGKTIQCVFYDSIEREFFEIKNDAHFFYDLNLIDSWKKRG